MNIRDKKIEFESGSFIIEETVRSFQRMLDDGSVWRMPESYGHTAMKLLEEGLCELGVKSCLDLHGNRIPSMHEVKSGTKGAPIGTRKKTVMPKFTNIDECHTLAIE